MKIVWFLFLLALVSCNRQSTQAPKGTTSSGGGDAYGGEFKDIARNVLVSISERQYSALEGVDMQKFSQAIESTTIETTDDVLTVAGDGGRQVRVDAKNNPAQGNIVLSLVNWRPHMTLSQKRRLVVHEFLEIMGIKDKGFSKSSPLLSHLGLWSSLSLYVFRVYGAVATTLIDKAHWTPEQKRISQKTILAEQTIETTQYFVTAYGQEPLVCEREEVTQKKSGQRVRRTDTCLFSARAQLTEGNNIVVKFSTNLDAIWTTLQGREGSGSFNYGLVTGESMNHALAEVWLYADKSQE